MFHRIVDIENAHRTTAQLQKQVPTQIDLYVTHLIASKGLDILRGKIDNLFCYHTVAGYLTMQDVHKFNKGE